jgi:hypothetical protein
MVLRIPVTYKRHVHPHYNCCARIADSSDDSSANLLVAHPSANEVLPHPRIDRRDRSPCPLRCNQLEHQLRPAQCLHQLACYRRLRTARAALSTLPPRWLTLPSTIILLIPLFSSSILGPLTYIFDPGSHKKVNLEDHLFYQIDPWSNAGGGSKGVDVVIYYRPPFAPFLRHRVRSIPFNDRECNSRAASAIVLPARKTVIFRCPNWPSQPAGTLDKVLPLR